MIIASITFAIVCVVVSMRCVFIDYHIRKFANGDYKALKDTKTKFSDTTKLFQQQFPKSAKKNKRKRHG